MMSPTDLEIPNKNGNTAFYLAVAAGNIKTVKIMLEKNRALATIRGSHGKNMPVYVAAMYGNNDVVKYLYEQSNNLSRENGWRDNARAFLLQKCVEADMFGKI
ncbi:putative ankyrin repeat-containing domain-containing protein [Helianthus anomalus]